MLATVLGWVGTSGTLGAYLMLSRGRLTSTSTTYALMNVVGGLLASTASATFGAWPSATANLLWALISLRTLTIGVRDRNLGPVLVQRWLLVRDRLLRDETLLAPPVTSTVDAA